MNINWEANIKQYTEIKLTIIDIKSIFIFGKKKEINKVTKEHSKRTQQTYINNVMGNTKIYKKLITTLDCI